MPNGSLDKVLYQETSPDNSWTWLHKLILAIRLPSVRTYLHQECEQQVIHRDIMNGTVLLDRTFHARLPAFGLANLKDHDKSPVSIFPAGTLGSLALEYLQYAWQLRSQLFSVLGWIYFWWLVEEDQLSESRVVSIW
jgi:serine/threonine protein kinase